MKTHFEHLEFYVPDLVQKRILDLGSGKGSFLIDATKHGAEVVGLEFNKEYIDISKRTAKSQGVEIIVDNGAGEDIKHHDESFDFVNVCEVIEHVHDPALVLSEVYRVLKKGGEAYVSVPSRFSCFDPHFHLAFVNWLPRAWADRYISIFGKHKDYTGQAGLQRLSEMHYYTFRVFVKEVRKLGFQVEDMRILKIKKIITNKFLAFWILLLYRLLRPWYFKTFHYKLTKE